MKKKPKYKRIATYKHKFIYPKWCKHPRYQDVFGCWTLQETILDGNEIDENVCKDCDMYTGVKKENG